MVEEPGNKLSVFISYARADSSAFAEELVAGLETVGFDPFLDRHDIAAGEDWEHRLGHLLQRADTVIYILSPAFVASERCEWEIRKAIALNKRLIPIVYIDVPEEDTPEELRRLNYIYFSKPNSFGPGLAQLTEALRTDLGWIREHTRLSELGARWQEKDSSEALLLRGPELASAQAWLAGWKPGAPAPSDLHRQYISKSAELEQRETNREAQRLAEIARAQEEREGLLRRMARVNRRWSILAAVLLVAGIAAGVVAFFLYQDAEDFRAEAESAKADAEAARADAEIARAEADERNAELDQYKTNLDTINKAYEALKAEMESQGEPLPLPAPGEPSRADGEPAPAGPSSPSPAAPVTSQRAVDAALRQTRIASGWDIDVFWCAGPNATANKAEADAIVARLTAEQNLQLSARAGQAGALSYGLGRLRSRELSEEINSRPSYSARGLEIRPEARERSEGEALAGFLNSEMGLSAQMRISGSSTPYYLSVFVCNGG